MDEKTILFGLGAIKGVGRSAIISLCEERQEQRTVFRPVRFLQANGPAQGQQAGNRSAGPVRRAG